MSLLLTRLRGTSTGGTPSGVHGTNIVDVKTLPGGQTLSETTTNTVVATTGLAFVVTIQDSGDSQEVGIKVTLTIQKPQGAIVRTKTLALINPGQTKSVTIGDLGAGPVRPEDDGQRRRRDRARREGPDEQQGVLPGHLLARLTG